MYFIELCTRKSLKRGGRHGESVKLAFIEAPGRKSPVPLEGVGLNMSHVALAFELRKGYEWNCSRYMVS